MTALILAIRSHRASYARNIVVLFTAFYGFTFYINPISNADSAYYRDQLVESHSSENSFKDLTSRFYKPGNKEFDIYQPLVTYIIARFTDDYQVLFLFFGIVLGIFYSRNIWLILGEFKSKLTWFSLLLIMAYAFSISIAMGINGVRFWTAAHVFIFGLLSYTFLGNRKFLIFCALSVLIHFSFILPVFVLMVTMFVNINHKLLYLIFLFSFFLNIVDFEIVRNIVGNLSYAIEDRTSGYINQSAEESYLKSGNFTKVWYLEYYIQIQNVFILVATSIIHFKTIPKVASSRVISLFYYSILLAAVINLISFIPSIDRFYYVSNTIILGLTFLFVANNLIRKNYLTALKLLSPILLLIIVLGMRGVFEWGSVMLLIGNPIISLIYEGQESIYSFLKGLL